MGCTLPHRLIANAGTRPDAWAIVDADSRVDYASLLAQARGFAAWLLAAGLQPGGRVALVLPNRIEAVVAVYGTWMAAGIVVPLNSMARSRDLEAQLRHCGARFLVHEAGNQDARLALDGLSDAPVVVALDEGQPLPAAEACALPELLADADGMILYTSGTTGAPKGVTLTHANLMANVLAVIRYLGLGPEDSVLQALPFHYAFGASVLHTHIAAGACVHIAHDTAFPPLLLEALTASRATGFYGVPSTYALLLEHLDTRRHDLAALRYLAQAGGAMSPALQQRLCAALPAARLYVMYGQTEATSRLSWLPPEQREARPGSVGLPIPGVQLRIAREDGSEAHPDEHGEVLARGANVMRGYWNAPQATAEVLRDGWLHTGDIGRLDADGYLYLAGRMDDVIKSAAHRIHPQDIEEVIAEMAGVREVAVVGLPDPMLGQKIKAYLVAPALEAAGAAPIKAHCRQRMAAYKIPREIEFVASLPRTASGKVRRAALREAAEPSTPPDSVPLEPIHA